MNIIEPLEPRIAPAVFATYIDPDGDLIRVTSSKGTQADIDAAIMDRINEGAGQRLNVLNLTSAVFEGADISIIATPKTSQSDGFVVVNRINATGRDLGKVIIDGDLGEIDAGNTGSPAPAIKSFLAGSMGVSSPNFGTSDIEGVVGTLTIKGLLLSKAALKLNHPEAQSGVIKIGTMGGGSDDNSGGLSVVGNVKSITVNGSILGGEGTLSGAILVQGTVGSVKVARDIFGGDGPSSGGVGFNSATSVTIGGDLVTGSDGAGALVALQGSIGKIFLGGNLKGPQVMGLAGILVAGDIGSIVIKGSMVDGGGGAGHVLAGFNVNGLMFNNAGSLKSFTLKGSILGENTATIGAGKNIGKAVFGRTAAARNTPLTILAGVGIGTLDFRGDALNVLIQARGDASTAALGTLKVAGDAGMQIELGDFAGPGTPFANPRVGLIKIAGDLFFSVINVGTLASTAAKLGSLQVGGRMFSTAVVAHEIGAAKIGGIKVALAPGAANDNAFAFGSGNSFDEVM
jgi:hypothetical protein